MRRFILIAALLLFTASCLYVPWRMRVPYGTLFVGYAPLWTGPRYVWVGGFSAGLVRERATIDYGRVGLECAALAALTAVALLLANRTASRQR